MVLLGRLRLWLSNRSGTHRQLVDDKCASLCSHSLAEPSSSRTVNWAMRVQKHSVRTSQRRAPSTVSLRVLSLESCGLGSECWLTCANGSLQYASIIAKSPQESFHHICFASQIELLQAVRSCQAPDSFLPAAAVANRLVTSAKHGARHSSSRGMCSHDLSWATLGLKEHVAIVSSQGINLCGHESCGLPVSQAFQTPKKIQHNPAVSSTDTALSTLPPCLLLQGFDQLPLPCLAACSSARQMPYARGALPHAFHRWKPEQPAAACCHRLPRAPHPGIREGRPLPHLRRLQGTDKAAACMFVPPRCPAPHDFGFGRTRRCGLDLN